MFYPDMFYPDMFSPDMFSPDMFYPDMFYPDMFYPDMFSPDMFSPDMFSPDMFSPDMFSPDMFYPDNKIPERTVTEYYIKMTWCKKNHAVTGVSSIFNRRKMNRESLSLKRIPRSTKHGFTTWGEKAKEILELISYRPALRNPGLNQEVRPRERSSLAIAKRNLMDDMVKDCYKRWPPGKIVNGKELPNAFYYPFLGTLGKKRTPNIFDPNPYSFSCGATLLNREFALTAGHCFGPDLGNRFDIIRLREHNVKKNEPDLPPPVDIPIAEQIVHPDYHHPSHENDIALLRRICNPSEAL
ncbi:unnamed protein product [Cyprideis torosa]|uniref:Uncharacterized protein n=1 Tax=Cyprideis torosa TaxID=163714 RepID=A0A7R8ZJE5_9CRUS|nr:unnamed protein product [Cyprideis torosa]CAG0879650.1 unnamed protein product [Cyprideis torosa]